MAAILSSLPPSASLDILGAEVSDLPLQFETSLFQLKSSVLVRESIKNLFVERDYIYMMCT